MDQYTNIPTGQHCCKGKGWALVVGLLLITIGIVASSFIVANTFYKVKALSNSIAVTGSAEKIVKSDTVKWSCDFSRTVSADMLKDGSNQMKSDLDLILGTFKQRDVKDSEITVQTMAISPICDTQNNVIYDQSGKQNCAGPATGGQDGKSIDCSVRQAGVDRSPAVAVIGGKKDTTANCPGKRCLCRTRHCRAKRQAH